MLPPTPTQHHLVSIKFRRKFPLLGLLLFLIDLKCTIPAITKRFFLRIYNMTGFTEQTTFDSHFAFSFSTWDRSPDVKFI